MKKQKALSRTRISALSLDRGYGFLIASDNRKVYFHKNRVVNHDFRHLKIGMEIRFTEEEGEKGYPSK